MNRYDASHASLRELLEQRKWVPTDDGPFKRKGLSVARRARLLSELLHMAPSCFHDDTEWLLSRPLVRALICDLIAAGDPEPTADTND